MAELHEVIMKLSKSIGNTSRVYINGCPAQRIMDESEIKKLHNYLGRDYK